VSGQASRRRLAGPVSSAIAAAACGYIGAVFARTRAQMLGVVWLGCLLSGCGGVRYVAQAAGGQWSLIQNARPIPKVIRDQKTPPRLRRLLAEVRVIKRYGEASGLKPTANYARYVQLDRPAVVWVVSACAPLQFKSKVWRFPIVGDFPYLGWFELKEANAFADELRKEGLDVDVRGASAYSTLGWFQDALLSSMISEGDEALGYLVNVVLHESVHATLHLPGQAYFNESLASFVADHLTLEYLDVTRGAQSVEKAAYEKSESNATKRAKRLHEAYDELDLLYRSARPDAEKLEEKARLLAALKQELKLRRDVNNAMLTQYRTYDSGQAELETLYRACGESWPRFFGALRELKPASFSGPHQRDFGSVVLPLVRKCA
jgi:predicted aminopeptidase